MIVRPLEPRDVDAVVARVRERLSRDARRNPLLSPDFSEEHFSRALVDATDQAWVAEDADRVTGHLYGALLESPEYGNGVWIGPDGVSFDDTNHLAALYSAAGAAWIARGALEHYAWVFDDPADTTSWYELGFARMHVRGVLSLSEGRTHQLPPGYSIRRGGPADLELALAIDETLDEAQRRGPSFSIFFEHTSRADEMLNALEDDEVHYYVVDHEGVGVAQCLTFPVETRRGSFDNTLHVSAVAVVPGHEHLGVARALIDHALNDAVIAGFRHVETNWRVTNRRASHFWVRYGFRPTYVRLHRTIGSG
ncbi:MAG: GNAT family N-acetyltransferase [Acidimicrobiales bacterium]